MKPRIIKYSDLVKEKRNFYRFRALNKKRLALSRRRNPFEREMLLKMDVARRKRYLREGRLVIISPRLWELAI
ncbi:MAG: hypothetical protein CVU77_00280 [Elusimicrobia bacterium HGW-Elusimicrobia-1]|nr:MAG: hypothetical protein CVU77_00280 [Elusimicrobia bacterium HGW-Elusimicrobia-1]